MVKQLLRKASKFLISFLLIAIILNIPPAKADPKSQIPIYQIQGTAPSSPYKGQTVATQGIVIGNFPGKQGLKGFFIQDPLGDGNPDTSDGIFIYAPKGIDVKIGDIVKLTGTVNEYKRLTQIEDIAKIDIVGTGSVTPTPIYLPLADKLEPKEGMLVTFPQTLTVSGNYNLGRYGQLILSDGRLWNPTQIATPGAAAKEVEAANKLNRIILDDGSIDQNPDPIAYPAKGLKPTNTLRSGDTVRGVTGVLDYSFGDYRIQPTQKPEFIPTNPRRSKPPKVGGSLKVAAFNLLNYFNGDGSGGGFPTPRGADTYEEFQRQSQKIINSIISLDADIIGLTELENDGYATGSAVGDLVNSLNSAQSVYSYSFVNPGLSRLGNDAIAVGLIYRDTVIEAGTAATTGAGAFADKNRQPLAQTFQSASTGEKFIVAVNHFKSKGGKGIGGDADIGDGQGNWNATRTAAAKDLIDWLAADPTGGGSSKVLILGDLNAYPQEDPLTALEKAGYTNLLNLFSDKKYYSYIYDGEAGALDYALGSPSLKDKVTGAAEWHINADEPRVLDYNVEFKTDSQVKGLYDGGLFRSSDHDPVVVGLDL